MVSTFESLPNEIQELVFKFLHNNSIKLAECMRVCKSWSHLFRKALYANVQVLDYENALALATTVKKSEHLRGLIRKLTLGFELSIWDRMGPYPITYLFSHLPNLEYINCSLGNYDGLLLDALLLGHLAKLKHIEMDTNGQTIHNYTSCAFILKDRLTHLRIIETESEQGELEDYDVREELSNNEFNQGVFTSRSTEFSKDFYRLFSKLNQFKSIEELRIKKQPENVIELIETVTQNCPSLERLNIEFTSENTDQKYSIEEFNNSIISKSLPTTQVKSLVLNQDACSNNPQLINYIMHKFPQLKQLDVYGTVNYDDDEIMFNKFLKYLSKIKSISVPNISCNGRTLLNSIDIFWHMTDPSRTLSLVLGCNPQSTELIGKIVDIEAGLHLHLPRVLPLSVGLDIIKKYGQFINTLSLYNLQEGNEYTVLQSLTGCVKLKKLLIISALTELNIAGNETFSKQSLDSLQLMSCVLENDIVLEKLSLLFARLNYLEISELEYEDDDFNSGDSPFKHINMVETEVGILSLKKGSYLIQDEVEEEPVVLVKLSIPEKETYYMYDFESMGDLKFKLISKEQFGSENDQNGRFTIDIRLKSLGILNVCHRYKIVRLTVS